MVGSGGVSGRKSQVARLSSLDSVARGLPLEVAGAWTDLQPETWNL